MRVFVNFLNRRFKVDKDNDAVIAIFNRYRLTSLHQKERFPIFLTYYKFMKSWRPTPLIYTPLLFATPLLILNTRMY